MYNHTLHAKNAPREKLLKEIDDNAQRQILLLSARSEEIIKLLTPPETKDVLWDVVYKFCTKHTWKAMSYSPSALIDWCWRGDLVNTGLTFFQAYPDDAMEDFVGPVIRHYVEHNLYTEVIETLLQMNNKCIYESALKSLQNNLKTEPTPTILMQRMEKVAIPSFAKSAVKKIIKNAPMHIIRKYIGPYMRISMKNANADPQNSEANFTRAVEALSNVASEETIKELKNHCNEDVKRVRDFLAHRRLLPVLANFAVNHPIVLVAYGFIPSATAVCSENLPISITLFFIVTICVYVGINHL